ncbi:MAG: adenosine kinase [Beijerinckiaceae bacterium]|jgi:sugar/nucleoside kinase (ribokinase family)|nr:adenosine kinase [Beijerinckiaceae bacterium]
MRHDVLALGNAIVDVIATAEDDFLIRHAIQKGGMTLIDEPRAEALYALMGPGRVVSGGSAANTIAGVASFGGSGAYIGKVRNDELGKLYRHDLTATGVTFATADAVSGPTTARCLIAVTPDGQRSMSTYLGACQGLSTLDVDADLVRASSIVYLEGYLWDPPAAKDAFRKASEIAHAAGSRVALTLSDSFCVDRWRDEFLGLIRNGVVDIVFANEHELRSLYQTADIDTAINAMREEPVLAVVTRSENGAMAITRSQTIAVPAFPVERVVDTTGAGDLFAAGFLFGLARDRDHRDCLRLGALAAAEIISHIGARPETSLRTLAEQNGMA